MNECQSHSWLVKLRGRVLARGLLTAVLVGSQCLIWLPRAPHGQHESHVSSTPLVVTISEGQQYGDATVWLNATAITTVKEAAEQLAQRSPGQPIQLRVSGGVVLQQLELVRRVIVDVEDAGSEQVRVSFTTFAGSTLHDASEERPNQHQHVLQEAQEQ